MSHLSEPQVVDLLCGEEIDGATSHLATCRRCAALQRAWRERLAALADLHQEEISDQEIHRLRVMYRHLGPRPIAGSRWIAALRRSSAGQLVAVRGVAAGTILEYSAGPYSVLLRIGTPDRRQRVAVYGQLSRRGDDHELTGRAAFTSSGGGAAVCDVDRFGEFFLPEGEPGTYRVVLWIGEEVVEIGDLAIGVDALH